MTHFSLQLRASKQITYWLCFLHLLALFGLSLYAVNGLLKLCLGSLTFIHAVYVQRYYARLNYSESVRILELNTRGEWWLHQNQCSECASLLANSLMTQYLIVLNFKTSSFLTKSVLLMRDSLSGEDWHRLREYLATH